MNALFFGRSSNAGYFYMHSTSYCAFSKAVFNAARCSFRSMKVDQT